MARDMLVSLGARSFAGRGVWGIAAFLFPSLAAVEQDGAAAAVLLYLTETVVALAILWLRLQVAWRASGDDAASRARLARTRQGVVGVLLMILICLVWGLGLAGYLTVLSEPRVVWATFVDRAGPMVAMLLLAAVLDTVVAPVRTPAWLETGFAWQASRSSVVVVSMLIGVPLAFWFGAPALVWSFLGLRLIADLGGLKRSERERIRANMFDGPATGPAARSVAKAPPRFSATHARYQIDDPRRLPE
jgi:hypothetical protein